MVTLLSEQTSSDIKQFSTASLATAGEPAVHSEQVSRMSYRDFEPFCRWYCSHTRRYRGTSPSEHTLRTKSVHLAQAANVLGITDEVYLGKSLSERAEVVFILDQLSLKMTPGALRQAYYALRSFGEYAKAMRWIPEHALRKEDTPPRNPDTAITVYSPEEMTAFVAAARGVSIHWWALLATLAHTGRRVGETLGMQWAWFRLDSDPAYIELPSTKNGENQYVPLDSFLRTVVFTPANIEAMKAGRVGRGKTPPKHPKDPASYPFPFAYSTAHGRFARFCERTGLPNRGFHNFRHTVITTRLANGMPLQAVSALAGHSSSAITDRRYNHTNALSYAKLLD